MTLKELFDTFPDQEFLAYLRKKTLQITIDEFTVLNGFTPLEDPPADAIDQVIHNCMLKGWMPEKKFFRTVRFEVRNQLAPCLNN